MTFCVFQNFYSRQPEFQNNKNIAVIGTLGTSMQFLGAPLVIPLVKKYHAWPRHMVCVGYAICMVSLVGASFCTSVAGLAMTQGAFYATGFLIVYCPLLSMMNEWFVRRRGLAYGIFFAGGGFSSAGLPFFLEWLLARFGYKITLRTVAVAEFVLIAPLLPMLKSRLSASPASAVPPVDFRFLAQPHFWVLAFSNLCQGLAYYIPSLYLPNSAATLGYSITTGAMILAANNMASILRQLSFGYLTDRVDNVHILVFVSTSMSAVAAFTPWGLAHYLELLTLFSITFGWFAGAYVVYWPKCSSMLSKDSQPIYGLRSFGKGLGTIITGPIAANLLTRSVTSGYGIGRFEPLVLLVGSLMAAPSLGIFGWPLRTLQDAELSRLSKYARHLTSPATAATKAWCSSGCHSV